MSKDTLKNYNEDYFLFLEAGFIAVNNTDEDSALNYFMASQILRPEDPFPKNRLWIYAHV